MKKINIKNKIIEVEDQKGNTILAFEVDENGNIIAFANGEVADIDVDTFFETNKELVRIQEVE